MEKETIVVFDKSTKEILACVSIDGKDCVCRKDVDFKIYKGTEPIFKELKTGIVLNENAFMLNPCNK
jgi:hypothetical protein